MVSSSLKNYNILIITFIVSLASLDLFRAYLEISIINYIFAFKEFFLLCLLFLLAKKNQIKISRSLWTVILLTLFYCSINVVDEDGILLSFIFLKYVLVFFLSYIIFKNLSLEVLQKGSETILIIFFIYSLAACIYAFVFPDSMIRAGRISGFANPSFLSYIYLLCSLYTFFQNRMVYSIWFIIVSFFTLTKTFFVAFCVVLIYVIIISSHRGKILITIAIIAPVLIYVITLNRDIYITYDKALTVLLHRDSEEYNSMSDRLERITIFKNRNSGNFILGYGTGKAGSSTVFLKEKIGKELKNLTDFENQILNIYYSLGITGLLLLYYPFINQFVTIFNKNTFLKNKHVFYLSLIVFVLYNLTLNILESFTSCIITWLFLIQYEKKIKDCY